MVIELSLPSSVEPIELDWLLREAGRKRVLKSISGVLSKLEALKKTISSGALRRSLMGFDQLNRLTAKTGKVQEDKMGKLLEFFSSTKLYTGFEQVVEKAKALGQGIAGAADSTDRLGDATGHSGLQASGFAKSLQAVIGATRETLLHSDELRRQMKEQVLSFMDAQNASEAAAQSFRDGWAGMGKVFHNMVHAPIKADIATLWDGVEPSMFKVKGLFSDAAEAMAQSFKTAWERVQGVFNKGGSVFDGLTDGVLTGFKKMVNTLIGGVNKVVKEPFSKINDLFSKLREFSIGDLKPFKNLGFSITMPQIPYLAKGAVLPANKPFMAVVGDQRHGTNIEAPLELIQSAVAQVMAESVDAQLAGHSATVEVLKQILEAVLGISLDDGAVARAVERHRNRMAVLEGGF